MPGLIERKRIRITGIVQGIGFRPFVYRLARRFHLGGSVRNTSDGVLVEVEGDGDAIDRFLEGLTREPPPFAQIDETAVSDIAPGGGADFTIEHSAGAAGRFVLISPDLATCDDCRREFTDPNNRRFGYPFANCTNCGPRYTIVRDTPYDRPMTTMASFRMCPGCQAEYDSPADRRFHAQPNACPLCGPSLSASIREVREGLAAGRIFAIKGLGGFHLACDAENEESVHRLRERKRRGDKPFALMAPDLATIERFCVVSEVDRQALLSVQRPIVVLRRRPEATSISSAVAPGNNTVAAMLPYTPLHHLLFEDAHYRVLVMTSGNATDEPIVTSNAEAEARLSAIADGFLHHDRDIYTRVDDSVVRTFDGRLRILRRSRGYAPHPIDLGEESIEVLAVGAESKNTFCLTKGRYALLSQHIGDLENYETLEFFRETLERMKKLFRVSPVLVAHDLHPGYLSTRFAREAISLPRTGVQHHHAHIASCMAENHIRDRVIGVAFDGTGYGTDGQIWGGEFLAADRRGFERRAHLRYVPMAGGDAAVREPWRVALGYLMQSFDDDSSWADLPLVRTIPHKKREVTRSMIRRGVNTVQTSSCGRLFDAVASILGLRQEVNFEGQAAIELETIASGGIDERYAFDVEAAEPLRIDVCPAIRGIVRDIRRAEPAGAISARFHNTVAAVILDICTRIRETDRLNRVCLSGGTFQNMYLLTKAVSALREHAFEVFLHSEVPPNDGGISLGQAVVALARSAEPLSEITR